MNFWNKSDVIDRLERQRNKSARKKPKKLTDDEYFQQNEILEQKIGIECLKQAKHDLARKLKFLKLESSRHGDDVKRVTKVFSGDEDKKRQGKNNRQPLDKNAISFELLSFQKPSLMEFGGDPTVCSIKMFTNSFDVAIVLLLLV